MMMIAWSRTVRHQLVHTGKDDGPIETKGESALEIIHRRLAVIRSRRLGREAGSSGEKPAVEDQQAEWGQAPRDE